MSISGKVCPQRKMFSDLALSVVAFSLNLMNSIMITDSSVFKLCKLFSVLDAMHPLLQICCGAVC